MPISIVCPYCGQGLRAPDSSAGNSIKCPFCFKPITVAVSPGAAHIVAPGPNPRDAQPNPYPNPPTSNTHNASGARLSFRSAIGGFLPHAHWLLALAMIPLVITLWDREIHYTPFVDRIVETLDGASDAEHDRIVRRLVEIKEGNGDVEELFDAFPRRRLAGAFLPRDSMMHWVFAFAASAIFLAFCAVLAGDGEASRVHILVVFLFTATIGILLLFALQALANLTSSYLLAGRGLFVVLFWAVKLIAYSYNAALDPNSNMIVSFLGFTVGVGLCEESCKLLPVIFRFREPNEYSWRNAFLLGLASGAGFGVAEGIIYAGNYYNGIAEGMTYLVRFASCVALHAVWTGSAAVTLFQRQNLLNQEKPWYDWVFYTIWFIAMPTVLHGIYDTMLKKGLPWAAAIAAIASFTWLAYHCTF